MLIAAQQSSNLAIVDAATQWRTDADWNRTEQNLIADFVSSIEMVDGALLSATDLKNKIEGDEIAAAIATDLQQAKSADISWGPSC